MKDTPTCPHCLQNGRPRAMARNFTHTRTFVCLQCGHIVADEGSARCHCFNCSLARAAFFEAEELPRAS
jgi:hypothetical protein